MKASGHLRRHHRHEPHYPLTPAAAGSELTLLTPCTAAAPTEDLCGEDHEHLGFLQIPFRIKPAETVSQTAPEKTCVLNGKPFEVTEALLSPTGLRIRFNVLRTPFPRTRTSTLTSMLTAGS